MSYSDDDVVGSIKELADIVQVVGETVELRRSGSRYVGLCPFHGEKTPSFSVNASGQYFHCFGCGASGDVFSYVMKYHSLTFPEAIKMLAGKYGVTVPEKKRSAEEEAKAKRREQMFAVNLKVEKLYSEYLHTAKEATAARNYLQKRGITGELAKQYGLGYAPSPDAGGWNFLGQNLDQRELDVAAELGLIAPREKGGFYDRFRDRILFSIRDISGRVCGYSGRIIGEGQPKYMNSPESPIFNKSKLLLGLYQTKDAIRKKKAVVFVEGNFDLVSLVAAGVDNVVAPLGTALTAEQVRFVKRYADSGTLLFDGDVAGGKAAVRSVPLFLAEQLAGKVALLPVGDDPDSFVRREGKKKTIELIEGAAPLPEFMFDHLVQEHGLSLDGKSRIVDGLKPLFHSASSSLQRSVILAHFAEKLGLGVVDLESNLRGSAQRVQQVVPVAREPMRRERPSEKVVGLDSAQKDLVQFMILNPSYFHELQDAGIREILQGTVGEILFLQMMSMVAEDKIFEPEELLNTLATGPERVVLAEILLEAESALGVDRDSRETFLELVEYLSTNLLKKKSMDLLKQIQIAERQGDKELLQNLLVEKIATDIKLQEY